MLWTSVQFSRSVMSTLCDPMSCSMPGIPVQKQLPEPTQTHVHWVGDAIQPSHPLLSSPSPPAPSPSQHQGLFQWVRSSHQVAKVLEFQLQYQSSNENSGLIFFRIDRFDLLTVQGTLMSLQHQNSKASILWPSAFFMVQLSHLHITIGKTIALTIWTFVRKVTSLLFNTVSKFVIHFLPRSKLLLILWLLSTSAVFLEPKKIKSVTASTFSPSICYDRTRCHELSILNVEF